MKNSCNTSTSSKMTFISDSVHGIVQFGSKICNPSSKLSSMPRPLKFSSSYVSLLIQFSSLPTITTRMTISKMPFQSEIQVRLLTIWYIAVSGFDQILMMIFLVFTYIFAAEAFLKILALGFITYLQDPWNTFDFVIVIISISDVFISLTSTSDEAQNSGLNVLRTLRFMAKNGRSTSVDVHGCPWWWNVH